MEDLTFERWMAKVNAIVSGRIGLSTDDLPDRCYCDMYEDGLSADEAASDVLYDTLSEEGLTELL